MITPSSQPAHTQRNDEFDRATAVYVIMGVSGSGKSTIGQKLAKRLGCSFYDGDDFHPPENIAKMAGGFPLNDTDRTSWLTRLADLIGEHMRRGETAVLTCSALKKPYRDHLRICDAGVIFIYLQGSYDLIWQRMQARQGHYMKADMLRSQFAALQEPGKDEPDVITISISQPVDAVVNQIITLPAKA